MNGTPRLRSAYPSSPASGQKSYGQKPPPAGPQSSQSQLPPAASPSSSASAPMIPFTVIDAPSQRLYALVFYAGLNIWRLSDYAGLVNDETESLWLFMKWLAIDSVFLYGLPEFQIPWLQLSSSTTAMLVILHTFLNALLMFRIPIPVMSWMAAMVRIMYDRELAVSERSVKPASILHNSSLILGKQIIHILPEGSAMLNPDQSPFCIGDSKSSINLPIRINQTNPILMELLRVDLDTNANETIIVTAKELSRLKRQADKHFDKNDNLSPRFLQYSVKETGLYRLQKVIDESKLEVQRRVSDTLVVDCPTAIVKSAPQNKCKGALSDFYLQVDATPPFKIKYSKTINRDDHGHVLLSIHPENLVSPLGRQRTSGALVPLEQSTAMDVSWAQAQSVEIPLNESLGVSGGWQYTIEEVHDACGNIANFTNGRLLEHGQQKPLRGRQLEQHFAVHERPRVALREYDSRHPIKVEKGKSKTLPIQMTSTGPGKLEDAPFTLSYLFTPQEEILTDQKHSSTAILKEVIVKDTTHGIEVREPGLYTLQSISTAFCEGEVMEPSSCLLLNPPEPDLVISAEVIPDKCAGSSIGLLVDLDLFGTPPFQIFYDIRQKGGGVMPMIEKIDHLHSQIELKPTQAGHYTYDFHGISDAIYRNRRPLAQKRLLEQDVKPPAAARIYDAQPSRKACIEEPVTFAIQILGEAPYTIDYELVHRGRRKKNTISDIEDNMHKITTEPLKEGGEYTLALTSVTDRSGCKIYLKEEAKVDVSLQRPRVAFGYLEGKRSTIALEAKKVELPLRLQGEAPWTVTYKNMDDVNERPFQKILRNSNDHIEAATEGTYQILDVHDATCPGSVDMTANQFIVSWIPRPAIQVTESPLVEFSRDRYLKKEVCEGDEDVTEVTFTGTAPFNVEYEQRHIPDRGSPSMSLRKFNAGLNLASLRMETSEAGLYEYKFSKLGDMSYNHDHRKFTPVKVQQRVNPKPSAYFAQAGKTYKYCQEEEAGGEVVPINLVGQPPFSLELEIKHHTTTKPEVINVPNVASNKYNLHVPHSVLALGTHSVTIRKVRDSRGCQRKMDYDAPHIQISVADIPSISPLEEKTDYCVGDRIAYALSGTPPFNVFYTFENRERKASVSSMDFRRIAETPGDFIITALSDQRSTDACKAKTHLVKVIHEMPSVRVSKGRTATVDIHEGGEAEILFEFGGTPPFHFTFTRSTTPPKGKKPEVLETKNEVSYDYSKTIRASDEGMYEVVSIRDKYCAFSTQGAPGESGQKLLTNR
ncbi:hypothetical protein P7C71_g2752, partial [Lecanoromycetidae sp. Uapishka_2]